LIEERPAPAVRVAAAHLLARWGADDFKRQGERELLALATGEPSVRNEAIQALGLLQVRSSTDVLRAQAVDGDEELKRSTADALFRLNDSSYVRMVTGLMNSRNEDMRRWSIQFARASHNAAFVSSLIDRLQDRGWNGATTTRDPGGPKENVIRHTLAEDALEALRRLTFQNLGRNVGSWRQWLEANKGVGWESLLNGFVGDRLARLARTEPHVMNEWMGQLDEADDDAVLPFVEGLLNHPDLDLSSVGPNSFSGGGGPPRVLLLLLELVDRGSSGARHLLYQCLTSRDRSLRENSPFAVAVFDRQKSLSSLAGQLEDRDPYTSAQAAQNLVRLGDARGIPRLIDELSDPDQSRRFLAFATLKPYTQEDIPFDPDAPEAARREMTARWHQWWRDHGADFNVKVRAAEIDSEVFF